MNGEPRNSRGILYYPIVQIVIIIINNKQKTLYLAQASKYRETDETYMKHADLGWRAHTGECLLICRGPGFRSQHWHSGLWTFVSPVPGYLTPSSGLWGFWTPSWCTYVYKGRHVHKIKVILFLKKKKSMTTNVVKFVKDDFRANLSLVASTGISLLSMEVYRTENGFHLPKKKLITTSQGKFSDLVY